MKPADRRNLILGLTLAVLVLGLIVGFMVLFSRHGLPKDPALWRKMQHQQAEPQS